jgi:hypothetical protein
MIEFKNGEIHYQPSNWVLGLEILENTKKRGISLFFPCFFFPLSLPTYIKRLGMTYGRYLLKP